MKKASFRLLSFVRHKWSLSYEPESYTRLPYRFLKSNQSNIVWWFSAYSIVGMYPYFFYIQLLGKTKARLQNNFLIVLSSLSTLLTLRVNMHDFTVKFEGLPRMFLLLTKSLIVLLVYVSVFILISQHQCTTTTTTNSLRSSTQLTCWSS